MQAGYAGLRRPRPSRAESPGVEPAHPGPVSKDRHFGQQHLIQPFDDPFIQAADRAIKPGCGGLEVLQPFGCVSLHGILDCIADRVGGQVAVGVDHVGVEGREFLGAGPGALCALGLAFAGRGFRGGRCDLRIALGGAFHCPVECLGSIGWGRVVPPGFGGSFDDPVFGQAEIIAPAAHMGPGWPALPPSGQRAVRVQAQRGQQL